MTSRSRAYLLSLFHCRLIIIILNPNPSPSLSTHSFYNTADHVIIILCLYPCCIQEVCHIQVSYTSLPVRKTTSSWWCHLWTLQARLPQRPPFSQHVSWRCCNPPDIPSSMAEILLFNSVFHDRVDPVSVSTLKLLLGVIGVVTLKPTSFSLYLHNQWTNFHKLSCTGKPQMRAICTYAGGTKAATNDWDIRTSVAIKALSANISRTAERIHMIELALGSTHQSVSNDIWCISKQQVLVEIQAYQCSDIISYLLKLAWQLLWQITAPIRYEFWSCDGNSLRTDHHSFVYIPLCLRARPQT